jgi:hypothetical protein
VEANRDDVKFHSGRPNSDWLQVDLGGDYAITKVVIYNRVNNPQRLNSAYLQLLNSDGVVTGQRSLNSDAVQTFVFSTSFTSTVTVAPICENSFQGGSWLLVRRAQGSAWSPATDHLLGKDVYGVYGAANSDSTFSISFSSLVTYSTEFLFATGTSVYASYGTRPRCAARQLLLSKLFS